MLLHALSLALVPARPQTKPGAELLRLKPVVDRRLEFGMRFTMSFTDTDGSDAGGMDASLLLAERVLRVEGERVTVRRHFRPVDVTGRGAAAGIADTYGPLMRGTYTLATDLRARTLGLGLEPADGGQTELIGGNTIDVTLPEGPVAPGDSWTGLYAGQIELRYTLRAVGTVGTRRVALIALAPAVAPAADTSGWRVAEDSLFALDLADGRWLRARAGLSQRTEGRTLAVTYAIARAGAPEWDAILAALPGKG